MSDVCIARTHSGLGVCPCSKWRKWPPIESSVGLDFDPLAVVASSGASRAASSRARRSAGRRCRARRQCCGRPSPATPCRAPRRRCASRPSDAQPPGCVRVSPSPARAAHAGFSASSCRRGARRPSAACRARADARSPRIRKPPRCRGCRSRDSARSLPVRPTVHNAVLPAVTPDSATDFFAFDGATAAEASVISFSLDRSFSTG